MLDERTRALLNARRLLSDISQITSKTDVSTLRQRAEDVLRHYPDDGLTTLIATQSSWLQWPCRSLNALSKLAQNECAMAPATVGSTVLFDNAMTVAQLLESLVGLDCESHVLFMTHYADETESDEVRQVHVPETDWTHERGVYAGSPYEVWYPGSLTEPRGEGYRDVAYETVRVVVLSDGLTNLRFIEPR